MRKEWSQEEDEFLLANYAKFGLKYVYTALNRTKGSVHNRARVLGVRYERVRSTDPKVLFKYDAITGDLFWAVNVADGTLAGDLAGCTDSKGYRVVSINGRQNQVHRIAWYLYYGVYPDGVIDHINGIPSDNRIENLRDATYSINSRNAKLYSTNSTLITGVHYSKKRKSFRARVRHKNKLLSLYCGKDFFEACCARKSYNNRNNFHENHGRIM